MTLSRSGWGGSYPSGTVTAGSAWTVNDCGLPGFGPRCRPGAGGPAAPGVGQRRALVPARLWARSAVPAWGREGRACPLCPELPWRQAWWRRVVRASQPLCASPVCRREGSRPPSGFSPVRPCEARLRWARDPYGRETHMVFPNLCVSAVLKFPKTGACCVKYKPKTTLNVSLHEWRDPQ